MPISAPTPEALAEAAQMLREGKLVAFPTETVYGLGGDATSDTAVAAIFAAKGRPQFNPLIIHVPDMEAAHRLADLSDTAMRLADSFWPGPLTLVLPRRQACNVSWLATAGLDTIALRCPAHGVAQALLKVFDGPIAAPSANPSGSVSPTTARHVDEGLGGKVAMILDAGPTLLGLESTIIGLGGPKPTMLRPGSVTRSDIETIIGPLAAGDDTDAAPLAPGRLKRHYATTKKLRLNATSITPDEALLAFGTPLSGGRLNLNLSPSADLREAAANLFAMLRTLDATDAAAIAVMPIPAIGLGEAINDRLARAATCDE
jgi:L-threonylcarbamoyladenylate synthase